MCFENYMEELHKIKVIGGLKMYKENMKYCRDCKEWLDINEFGNNKNYADGKQPYCKVHYNIRRKKSYKKGITRDVSLLIASGIIQNTRINRIAASLLLRSADTRIADEFPCQWDNRLDFAKDLILNVKDFWSRWLGITKIYDKETDETEKYNLRPTIDRIIENPSVGYRLENVQPLSFLDNTLKTVKQSYDVINMSDNTTLTDKKKIEIIDAFSSSAEYLKNVIDGGLVDYNGKLYLFQSKDRTEGKHKEILKKLADNSEGQYDLEMIIKQPIAITDGDGNIIKRGTLTMPFKVDSRFVSAKVSDSPLSIKEAKNFKPTLKIMDR